MADNEIRITSDAIKALREELAKLELQFRAEGNVTRYNDAVLRLRDQFSATHANAKNLSSQLIVLDNAMGKSANAARGGIVSSIQELNVKLGNTRPLVMSMSQAMQDSAQFSMGMSQGIRAVANNVEMMVQQMTYLKSSGMSVGEIFTALRGSLMGPMGLLFAFSLVSAATQWIVQGLTKTKAELKATQEQAVKTKEDFVKLSAEIKTMFPNDKRTLEIIVSIKKSLVTEATEIEEKMKKLVSEGRGQETIFGIKTEYGQLKSDHDVLIRQIQQGNLGLKDRAQLVKFIVELAATGREKNVKQLLLSGGYTEAEIDGVSKALKAQFNELKIGTEAYTRYALANKAVKDAQDSLDPEKTKRAIEERNKLIEKMYEESYKLMRKPIDVRGQNIVDAFPGLAKNAEFMKNYSALTTRKEFWAEPSYGKGDWYTEQDSTLARFQNLQDVKRMGREDVYGLKGVGLKSAGMYDATIGIGESLKGELDKVKPEAELFSNTMAQGFREATNVLADGLQKALGLGDSLAERLLGTLLSGFLQLGMNYVTGGLGSVLGFAGGGMINEPVVGMGMRSRSIYTLAERGPEYVSPASANRMGQQGRYGGGGGENLVSAIGAVLNRSQLKAKGRDVVLVYDGAKRSQMERLY